MKALAIAALALLPALTSAESLVIVTQSAQGVRFALDIATAKPVGNGVSIDVVTFPGEYRETIKAECHAEQGGRIHMGGQVLWWSIEPKRVYDYIGYYACYARRELFTSM